MASCSFNQWRMNIVGPFWIASLQRKFMIIVVDYFSKLIEAEPMAKINGGLVKFLSKNIICWFGILHHIISDNGRQF